MGCTKRSLHVSLAWNRAFIQLLSQYGSLDGSDIIHLWTPPKKALFRQRWIWISGIDVFFFCLFLCFLHIFPYPLWKVELSGSPFDSTVMDCNFPLTSLGHWSRHFTTGNSNHFITGYAGIFIGYFAVWRACDFYSQVVENKRTNNGWIKLVEAN